jgi:hypothetical protein
MRILLDAQVSSRRVGRPLMRRGHDVVALDSDPQLATLPDDEILAFAANDRRIVVTHEVKDFARLVRAAGEAGRSHGGCILVLLPTNAHGAVLRGVESLLCEHATQSDWVDRVEFLTWTASRP